MSIVSQMVLVHRRSSNVKNMSLKCSQCAVSVLSFKIPQCPEYPGCPEYPQCPRQRSTASTTCNKTSWLGGTTRPENIQKGFQMDYQCQPMSMFTFSVRNYLNRRYIVYIYICYRRLFQRMLNQDFVALDSCFQIRNLQMLMIAVRHQDRTGTIKILLMIAIQARDISPIVHDNSLKSYHIISQST